MYCSSELKVNIKDMSRFDTYIRDDPLCLLQNIEHLMHVPMKAVYLTLTLIEAMSRMISIKQGEREGLSTYLERFKSKKNFLTNLYGYLILDGYVERLDSYQAITGSEDDKKKMQKALKIAKMDTFWAMLFMKGIDQSRFGGLMMEYC